MKSQLLIADDTSEKLQHVGTLKYINLFTTHVDTHIQRVGYIINGQYININVFLLFFSFLFLVFPQIERGRERIYNWV